MTPDSQVEGPRGVAIEYRVPPQGYWQGVKGWYDPRMRKIVVYRHAWWLRSSVEVTLLSPLTSNRGLCAGSAS